MKRNHIEELGVTALHLLSTIHLISVVPQGMYPSEVTLEMLPPHRLGILWSKRLRLVRLVLGEVEN